MAEPMTEAAPEPADTAVDAPVADTDIDALLAEFEAGTQVQPPEQIGETAAERDRAIAAHMNAYTEGLQIDARRAELRAHEQALQMEIDRKDAFAAFAEIRGNLPADLFDDGMIDAWVNAHGASDPAIRSAWENRVADPRTYQRVLNKLSAEFGERFRKYQSEDEIDRAAIAQAVRGAGGKVPAEPPPRFDRMSDAELAQWKAENMK